MPLTLKTIVTPLLLAAFFAAAFFSFAAMSYGPDGRMMGDCPFSPAGAATCPQGALPATLHHISAYQSFLAAPIASGLAALLAMLAAIGLMLALVLTNVSPPLARAPSLARYEPPPLSYDRKLLSWLSLFEHSPSV